MNKRGILYYPEVHLNDRWLKQVILYFDEVSSIFPFGEGSYESTYGYYDDRLVRNRYVNEHTSYLLREGIYRPLNPDMVFWSESSELFKEEVEYEFEKIIKSHTYMHRKEMNYSSRRQMNIHIHSGKVAYFIKELFERYKEYKVIDEYDEWYEIDYRLGHIYMSILAKYMAIEHGKEIGQDIIIGTSEDKVNHSIPSFNKRFTRENHPVLELGLNKILPVPNDNVSYEEILLYKREMKDELLKFRRILRDLRNNINEEPERMNQIIVDYGDDIYIQSKELLRYNQAEKNILHLERAKTFISISENIPLIGNIINLGGKIITPMIDCGIKHIDKKYIENVEPNRELTYISEAMKIGILNRY